MIPRLTFRGVACVTRSTPRQIQCKHTSIPKRTLHTNTVLLAESEKSVKKTVEAIKDKGEIALYDVQVGDIIAAKPDQRVVTIAQNATVFDAVSSMSTNKVGALVVVDTQSKKPVGIISERDYLNKVVIRGLSSKSTQVHDIMTKDIVTTRPNVSASKCMDTITRGRFRHVPVVDDQGSLIGLISIGDLVKHVVDQQKVTIDHLKRYIEGSY